MKVLPSNDLEFVFGGDGNDGQAELIAIGAAAGTFISPGLGSIAGAYIGDKVHSWATTHTVDPSMSPSGLGGTLNPSKDDGPMVCDMNLVGLDGMIGEDEREWCGL